MSGPSVWERLRGWAFGISRGWLIAAAAAGAVIVIVGGALLFRTYNYVQYNNNFCLQCHLMAGPYARFQQSAHRGLGCKACHHPTPIARAKMGLTQIIKQPTSIEAHAEVPNSACEKCHVEGNPREWTLISASVGHRIHFESKDTALKGLACVRCHSVSIHEFAPVDRTCAQAGCHTNTKIKLGKMGQLTIHCVVCHNFNKPDTQRVGPDSLALALRPQREECLSCHAMRQKVGVFPANEPHKGVCGACHDPHTQSTPAEAVQSCSNGGCHERADTITPAHRGLEPGVLERCTNCHVAHTWKPKGQVDDCRSCHTKIFEATPPGASTRAALPPPPRGPAAAAAAGSAAAAAPAQPGRGAAEVGPAGEASLGAALLRLVGGASHARPASRRPLTPEHPFRAVTQEPQQPVAGTVARWGGHFDHRTHRQLDCLQCHSMQDTHGALKVRTKQDCESCHHSADQKRPCASCHTAAELGWQRPEKVEVRTSVSRTTTTRTLPFPHARHTSLQCSACHGPPPTYTPRVDCESCHSKHHQANAECRLCHAGLPLKAHTRAAHLACGGSGCHQDAAVASLSWSREVCLACHQDRVLHEPGLACESCHKVPALHSTTKRSAP